MPCLESVAAVLAAKLSALVFREFVRFDALYFCTNATVLLLYIRDMSTRFFKCLVYRIELFHT